MSILSGVVGLAWPVLGGVVDAEEGAGAGVCDVAGWLLGWAGFWTGSVGGSWDLSGLGGCLGFASGFDDEDGGGGAVVSLLDLAGWGA